jgi:hypothetical protein
MLVRVVAINPGEVDCGESGRHSVPLGPPVPACLNF